MWQETADLVTLTEEILNGKLHFLFSVWQYYTVFGWAVKVKTFKSIHRLRKKVNCNMILVSVAATGGIL